MNEDFQARLARLEAKNGPSDAGSGGEPPYTPPQPSQNGPSGGGRGGGGGGFVKMIIIGIACLVVIPAGAVFATIYMPQIKDAADKIKGTADRAVALVELSREIEGDGSKEQRAASRELDGVLFRMTTGTMSAKEEAYWKSAEGNARMQTLERQAMQMDHEKLMDASKRVWGVD